LVKKGTISWIIVVLSQCPGNTFIKIDANMTLSK
jgi:hypothetical protein